MTITFLVLKKSEPIVRGILRNALYEPQPNVFVGRLDRKRIEALVGLLKDRSCNAVLICVSQGKDSILRFKSFGNMTDREITQIDGLDFVRRKLLVKSTG